MNTLNLADLSLAKCQRAMTDAGVHRTYRMAEIKHDLVKAGKLSLDAYVAWLNS